jgi:hypothetical protein
MGAIRFIWFLVLIGIALLVYPFFLRIQTISDKFSPKQIEALQRPTRVQQFALIYSNDPKAGERGVFGARVSSLKDLDPDQIKKIRRLAIALAKGKDHGTPSDTKPQPQVGIRFTGPDATVDLIIDVRTTSVWFADRESVRPFFGRPAGEHYPDLAAVIAMPSETPKVAKVP